MIAILDKPRCARGDWPRQARFNYEWAKRYLLRGGTLPMTILLHSAAGIEAKIVTLWEPALKQRVMRIVALACIAKSVRAVSGCSEAWAATGPAGSDEVTDADLERARELKPSESPDRIDTLHCWLVYSHDGAVGQLIRSGEIKRNAKGAPSAVELLPWMTSDNPDVATGGYILESLRPVLLGEFSAEARQTAADLLIEMNKQAKETVH